MARFLSFPSSYNLLIYVVCFVAWGLILVPPVLYLSTLWKNRRENLLSLLKASSLQLYFRQFHPADFFAGEDFTQAFKKFFHQKYGRQHYALPYLMLFVLTTFAAYTAKDELQKWFNTGTVPHALPAAAFAGAFLWVTVDQLDRIRKRDVTPYELWGYSLRIIVAVPFGWALGQFAKEDVAVPLAFALGAFPTRQLIKVAKRLSAQNLHLADEPAERAGELERLQCISKPAAERYAAENVETIVDLAYKDPIDLCLRTNFEFNYVIDCINQALLWMYFEDDIKNQRLYELSLRGAQEAAGLLKDYEQVWSDDVEARKKHVSANSGEIAKRRHSYAEHAIKEIAEKLHISENALMVTLRQVADDPYTKFLCALWADMKPAAGGEPVSRAAAA